MSRFVYDAAVLIAADKNDRCTWADHKIRLETGPLPFVPATVVAQVSRSPRQAHLRRFLSGCRIVPFNERDAHEAGQLLAKSKTTDVVDASVVITALNHGAAIITGDEKDIARLVFASGAQITVNPL